MPVKRFAAILAIICVLGVALAIPATAHAQTKTSTSQQQQTVATDQSEYWFYAGSWGWGYCFSHSTIQSFANGWGHGVTIVAGFIGTRFGPVGAWVASSSVEGIRWYMEAIDRGNGDCIAFAYGNPLLPVAWAR